MRRKYNNVNDLSNGNYSVGNEIIYNTEILKSNLCNYNNACILVKGDITVTAAPALQVAFKNCATFSNCFTKIDGTIIDDAEDLDLVMPMYNTIEYSSTYSETTESLWFYSQDETTNLNADIANTNGFKLSKYKTKLLGNTELMKQTKFQKNSAIAVALKSLSNFWRSLKMPLINCKIELILKWTKYCVLSAAGNDNENDNDNIIFTIKNTKL